MKLYEPPTKEFFRLPNNIFDLGLTPIQFTLYSYLVSCAGSSTICWPSLKTICAKTGIGLTAVQNHLTAGRYRYEDSYLDGLRDYCVQQVKALNGRVDLKEIQKAYEG